MKRTLLIDGDTLVFEAAIAHEYEAQWDWGLWTLHAHLDPAIVQLDAAIDEIAEKLQASRVIIALSDDSRWRNAVMPEYKNHRQKTRKPIIYRPLREYLHETREVFQRPGLEGDDVLGILSTHPKLIDGEKIIVSLDKDMYTIPGLIVNYKRAREDDHWEPTAVGVAQADYNHMLQTLSGDTTDGYKGCPGLGPKKAADLLMPVWQGKEFPVKLAWQTVVSAYQREGLGELVALQNARVARICRHTDYDFKEKQVRLWTPPFTAGVVRVTPKAPENASSQVAASTKAALKKPANAGKRSSR